MRVSKLIKDITKKHIVAIAIGFIFIIAGSFISMASPLITRTVIDNVIPEKEFGKLLGLGILYLAVFFGSQIISFLHSLVFTKITQSITMEARVKIYKHALRNYQNESRYIEPGDALNRLTGDLPEAASFITTIVVEAIDQFITLFFALGVMFVMDIRLALIVAAGIPIIVIANEAFLKPYKKLALLTKEKNSEFADSITENWQFRAQIFYYRAFNYSSNKIGLKQEKVYKANISMFFFQSFFGFIQGFVSLLPPFLVLFLGAFWVINGSLTLGAIVAAMSYIGRVYNPIRGIVGFRTRYQSYRVCVERLESLIGDISDRVEINPDEKKSQIELIKKYRQKPQIIIEDMDFAFNDSERPITVFQNFSMALNGPGIFCIKGDNGRGKTTLMALLLGALIPQRGKILLNGVEAYKIPDEIIKNLIHIVPQYDAIFTGNLQENYSLDFNAADSRGFDDSNKNTFEKELKETVGQDSIINITSLSGGQCKKISIIRAMYNNTPILILDEPFAPLDTNSRKQTSDWIVKKSKNCLVILIDHSGYMDSNKCKITNIFL